jgi:hypothetical protein
VGTPREGEIVGGLAERVLLPSSSR